jgi:hypothetical protein
MRSYTTIVLVSIIFLVGAAAAQAGIIQWNAGAGNWSDGGSWSHGIAPADPDVAIIDNNTTVTVDSSQSCSQLILGNDWNYDTNVYGGVPTGSGIIRLVNGANVNVTQGMEVGDYNNGGGLYGQVMHEGGTLTVVGWFELGARAGGAEGYYNLYGGTLDVNASVAIGKGANSTFGVIGGLGTMDVLNNFHIWGNGQLAESFRDATGVSTITVHGAAALSDARLLLFVDEAAAKYNAGDSWTVLSAVGGLTGTFLSAPDGGTITSRDGLHNFRINYSDTSVTLTALDSVGVPEPSTIVLLGSSLLGLLAYAWRRRK